MCRSQEAQMQILHCMSYYTAMSLTGDRSTEDSPGWYQRTVAQNIQWTLWFLILGKWGKHLCHWVWDTIPFDSTPKLYLKSSPFSPFVMCHPPSTLTRPCLWTPNWSPGFTLIPLGFSLSFFQFLGGEHPANICHWGYHLFPGWLLFNLWVLNYKPLPWLPK